jgi:diguanylate cyclase (GGDEF)-like protein
MVRSRYLKDLPLLIALAVVYLLAGKLALKLAFVNASVTPAWPCTGIALAAFLILGYRVWPGILVGAFLVNLLTTGSIAASLGIAVGNTLEGVVGCYLVIRFARGQHAFKRAQEIFKFAFLVGMVSTPVSATIGVTTLGLKGLTSWATFAPVWYTWWLGDAAGAVVLTPFLILWRQNHRLNWTRKQIVEMVLLFSGLLFTSWVVFGARFHSALKDYPLEYLCIPFLIWAALRLGRRKAATAICVLAVIATWGTAHGFGPFARRSHDTSLLLLQAFMCVVAILTLALAAQSAAHNRAVARVQQLVITDPLTGLANYRRLLDALDAEIKRCERTQRSFGVVLLDLDGLKAINDTHGHLVGTRALCRVANMLRIQCREMDTAARYGGDEFVLILPETDPKAVRTVVQRIHERLRDDGEEPPISVSAGTAIFPRDGRTINELLGAADRSLYHEKDPSARKSGWSSRP